MKKGSKNHIVKDGFIEAGQRETLSAWKKKVQDLNLALKKAEDDNTQLRKSALGRIEQMSNQIEEIFKIYSNRSVYSRQNAKTQVQMDEIKKTYETLKATNEMMGQQLKNKQGDKTRLAEANKQITNLKITIGKMKLEFQTQKQQMRAEFKTEIHKLMLALEQEKGKQSVSVLNSRSINNQQLQQFYQRKYKELKEQYENQLSDVKKFYINCGPVNMDKSVYKSYGNEFHERSGCVTFDEDQMVRRIKQSVEAVIIEKDRQYADTIQKLQLKNNQHLVDIMTLQGSVMVLRKQLAEALNRQTVEQHINQKLKRIKSLSRSQKFGLQQQKFGLQSPRNNSDTFQKHIGSRGNWKNSGSMFRSTYIGDNGSFNMDNNGEPQKFMYEKRRHSFIPTFKQEVISEVFEPGESLRINN